MQTATQTPDYAEKRHVISVRKKLEEQLETEATRREAADQTIKRQLEALKTDISHALQAINAALDRLEAPPSKEESPALARMQETLDDLAARVGSLELTQRQITARLKL